MLFYLALLFAVVMSVCETETGAWNTCMTDAATDLTGQTTCDTQFDAMVSCNCGLMCTSECEAYYDCVLENPLTQLTACAGSMDAFTVCLGVDGGDMNGMNGDMNGDDMCMAEMEAYYTCTVAGNCTDELDLYMTCLMAAEGVPTECTTQYQASFDCHMENEDNEAACATQDNDFAQCYMMNSGDDCMVCQATNEETCPAQTDANAYCTCMCSACFNDCTADLVEMCANGSQDDCVAWCEGDVAAGDDTDYNMCNCDNGVDPDVCGVCGGDATDSTTCDNGDGAMGLLLSVVFFLQVFLW